MSDDLDPVIRRLRASAPDPGDGVSVESVARGVRARRDARRRAAGALVVIAVAAPVSWAVLKGGGSTISTATSAGAPAREADRAPSAPKDAMANGEGGAQQPQASGPLDCPPQLPASAMPWVPVDSASSAARLVPTTTPAAGVLCSYSGLAGSSAILSRSVQITGGLAALARDLNALPTASPRPCPSQPSGSPDPARYLLHLRYADGSDAWVGVTEACGGSSTNGSATYEAPTAERLRALVATGRWR